MQDGEIPELITDKTIIAVFLAVLISSGTAPLFELAGYTHPGLGILGSLVGGLIAVYEARKVQQRIDDAMAVGLASGNLAPGL